MFHLPAVPFAEIDEYLVRFAVVAATSISIYQFLRYKLRVGKDSGKRRQQRARLAKRVPRADGDAYSNRRLKATREEFEARHGKHPKS
jgi:hypothetical protein